MVNVKLETIVNKYKGRKYFIEIKTSELTAICPVTKYPDFYTVRILYVPKDRLIELKSLKLYFLQFRNIEITHEELLNKIFEDLKEILKPQYLRVELDVAVRGGIKVRVWREEGSI